MSISLYDFYSLVWFVKEMMYNLPASVNIYGSVLCRALASLPSRISISMTFFHDKYLCFREYLLVHTHHIN